MKVLVTRRREDSERTAGVLAAAGFGAVLCPLSEVEVINSPMPEGAFDFVLFSSANGVRSLKAADHSRLKDLPVFAVGSKTAEALQKQSYTNVRFAERDAKTLSAKLLEAYSVQSAQGLFVCGEERAFDIETVIEPANTHLTVWETYRMAPVDPDPEALRVALETVSNGLVFLYSAASTRRLVELSQQLGLAGELEVCRFVAISRNCAEQLPEVLRKRALIAQTPDESAMIAMASDFRGEIQ